MIIYADDTTFFRDKNSGEEIVGVGCLLLDDDNTPDIISSSLEKLSKNKSTSHPRATSMDSKTVGRGYFHASEDSYNAHTILAESVNTHLTANFQYSYSPASQHGKDGAWNQCLQYLSIMTNQSKAPVKIYLEQRSAHLKSSAEKTIIETNHAIDWGKYDHYAIPSFFPEVEVQIVDKLYGGIQIVDLLLWANNRKNYNDPDKISEARFKFTSKSQTGDFSSYLFQGDMIFKKGIRENLLNLYPKDCFPLPEFTDNDHISKLFELITSHVASFLTGIASADCVHIQRQFSSIVIEHNKHNQQLCIEVLRLVASCFIRIFDMVPVYHGADVGAFQQMLLAKRLCGLILRRDIGNSTRVCQFLVKQHRDLLKLPTSPNSQYLVPTPLKDGGGS